VYNVALIGLGGIMRKDRSELRDFYKGTARIAYKKFGNPEVAKKIYRRMIGETWYWKAWERYKNRLRGLH
jgi:hypothetical protein